MAVGHLNTFTRPFISQECGRKATGDGRLHRDDKGWQWLVASMLVAIDKREKGTLEEFQGKEKRPTALGIPRRSPIQVLTQPNAA